MSETLLKQPKQQKPQSGLKEEPGKVSLRSKHELWRHVGELASSSAMLQFLAEAGSDRLSLTQASFFLLAATADAAGRPATRTELIAQHFDSGSIRNSYRQLLEPSRVFPKALGWLTTEQDLNDARQQLLRLTEKGKSIIGGVLLTLEPLVMAEALSKATH